MQMFTKLNWVMVCIGVELIIIAIPISSGANKKAKKAVELYNKKVNNLPHSSSIV